MSVRMVCARRNDLNPNIGRIRRLMIQILPLASDLELPDTTLMRQSLFLSGHRW